MVLSGPPACCEPSDLKSNITFLNIFHTPPFGGFFDSCAVHPFKLCREGFGRCLGGDWSVKVGATDRA